MILIINGGSSSIKFALCGPGNHAGTIGSGEIKRIGMHGTVMHFKKNADADVAEILLPQVNDFGSAIIFFSKWLEENTDMLQVTAIGHRVVQGMQHTRPTLISTEFLAGLGQWIKYDPEHLPAEISLMETLLKQYPLKMQVACFDTFFHSSMPPVARLLPLPRKYAALGVRRYGYHGLAYEYLMHEIAEKKGKDAATGKIVLAHLGSGASMVAVEDGKSIDTSMGFTPSSGLMMATRPGDIDPGVVSFLLEDQKLSQAQYARLINHQSGLLAVSGTTGDMGLLLEAEKKDGAAAEAIALFCYQARKYLGAYSALLEGLDMLVFSGGIGENSAAIRSRICNGFSFLGMEIDEEKNTAGAWDISAAGSKVTVLIIPANEAWAIAHAVKQFIAASFKTQDEHDDSFHQ